MKIDEKNIVKILLRINPKIKPYLNKKKLVLLITVFWTH